MLALVRSLRLLALTTKLVRSVLATAVVTKAVVANCVVLVAAAAVGAAGMPVNVGAARLALVAEATAIASNSTLNSVPLIVLRGLPEARASFVAKFTALV